MHLLEGLSSRETGREGVIRSISSPLVDENSIGCNISRLLENSYKETGIYSMWTALKKS